MTDRIRTRADGSIDTAHYIAKGRRLRSEQAHDMARRARPGRSAPVLVVIALAVLLGAALPLAA